MFIADKGIFFSCPFIDVVVEIPCEPKTAHTWSLGQHWKVSVKGSKRGEWKHSQERPHPAPSDIAVPRHMCSWVIEMWHVCPRNSSSIRVHLSHPMWQQVILAKSRRLTIKTSVKFVHRFLIISPCVSIYLEKLLFVSLLCAVHFKMHGLV